MWCRNLLLQAIGGQQNKQLQRISAVALRRCYVSQIDSQPVSLSTTIPLNDVEDSPYTLTKDQENFITKGDHEKTLKLNELYLRLYIKKQQGHFLPDEINMEDVDVMLTLNNIQLSRLLIFIGKRLNTKRKGLEVKLDNKLKFDIVKQQRESRVPEENTWLEYRLNSNSLFPRIYKSSISCYQNTLAAKALQFGQRVIIDCSYDEYMDDLRLKHTAKQILFCYNLNRLNSRPFSLHLCNLDKDSRVLHYIKKMNPEFLHDLPIGLHSCSYLDLFERQKLVYLTPHTQTTVQYNPDDVYILGAIVDKIVGLPLSSKKAVKEKIRFASLPLNKYLKWKMGGKNLCIHQCFNCLLTVKNTGDWEKALLENVPHRKIHLPDNED